MIARSSKIIDRWFGLVSECICHAHCINDTHHSPGYPATIGTVWRGRESRTD